MIGRSASRGTGHPTIAPARRSKATAPGAAPPSLSGPHRARIGSASGPVKTRGTGGLPDGTLPP
ncbi:hypothetical protein GCM10022252_56060 [Streptosporangium oxazolinicum]|uniref:Uncharacterized protein n=1 Tax=Streptosporangium oxazolinicum TaxID=909287 RepID=A0ABP8B9I3_9ACTN